MDISLQFSQACIDLICTSEGFVAHPYPDPGSGAEPYTIGYGTTVYCNGIKVTMDDTPISQSDAQAALLCHLNSSVLPCLHAHVTSDINQNQLDALGSFVYNIGCSNFKSSTVLREVNIDPSNIAIHDAFAMWTKASGHVLQGLVIRRNHESLLYFS